MKCVVNSVLICLVVLSTASETQAATVYVANVGVDSGTCGAQSDPCRSIGQAIANATAGDTISVGPGSYGDLTGNGDFLSPGEEPGGAACGTRGIICVDKALIVESSHGADATLLQDTSGVEIRVDGVTFGRPGKGFKLSGGSSGLRLFLDTSGNSVAGNTFTGTVYIDGAVHSFAQNRVEGEYGAGVEIAGISHSILDNLISASPSINNGGGAGFVVYGTGHSVIGNLVVSKSSGMEVNSGASDIVVQGNSFLGNGHGVRLTGGIASINGNNIFANAVADGPVNCGLVNSSGETIDATKNFWGAASGPGPDPADQVCDEPGSTTNISPFATVAFPIVSTGGGGGGNGAPVCTAAQAVPTMLWPANGQFTRAWIIGVGDPDDDPVSISITGVTQDEPVISSDSGDTGPDAVLFGSSVDLRAQRIAAGNGRVYRVQFSATDGNGGSCTGAVTVGVPNSQKPGQAIVDDGQIYTSTQP